MENMGLMGPMGPRPLWAPWAHGPWAQKVIFGKIFFGKKVL